MLVLQASIAGGQVSAGPTKMSAVRRLRIMQEDRWCRLFVCTDLRVPLALPLYFSFDFLSKNTDRKNTDRAIPM